MAAPHFPIRAVARMTGLGVDTLRAWERRYQAVTPLRDERGRVYSAAHVARLKQLADLVAHGHAIGRIAGLSTRELAALATDPQTQPTTPPAPAAADLAPLLQAIREYDLTAIETQLNRQAALLPPHDLIFLIVLPALREVGERWKAGTIRPAQEHLVSAVFRSILGSLLRTLPASAGAKTIVMASPAGDRHELALLASAVLARASGFHVVYLGPDLPAADVAHAATTARADILLLSATVDELIDREDLKRFAKVTRRLEIWAGGPGGAMVRHTVGSRVRVVDRLEDLPALLHQHVA